MNFQWINRKNTSLLWTKFNTLACCVEGYWLMQSGENHHWLQNMFILNDASWELLPWGFKLKIHLITSTEWFFLKYLVWLQVTKSYLLVHEAIMSTGKQLLTFQRCCPPIFRVLLSDYVKMQKVSLLFVTINQSTWHCIPKDLSLDHHCSGHSIKSS